MKALPRAMSSALATARTPDLRGSNLDAESTEHFTATINQLHDKVTMLFIAHGLPGNLKVDEVVRIGETCKRVET